MSLSTAVTQEEYNRPFFPCLSLLVVTQGLLLGMGVGVGETAGVGEGGGQTQSFS